MTILQMMMNYPMTKMKTDSGIIIDSGLPDLSKRTWVVTTIGGSDVASARTLLSNDDEHWRRNTDAAGQLLAEAAGILYEP